MHQYTEKKFYPDFASTVGIDFKQRILTYRSQLSEKSWRVTIQLWDTAGSERYRSLTKAFYRDAFGFILVFDLTKESSFLNVQFWINELKNNAYCDDPDIIIVGNKLDLEKSRVIDFKRAQNLAENNDCLYIETSALSGKNVDNCLDILLNKVMDRIEKNVCGSTLFRSLYIKAKHENENNVKICC